MNNFITQQLLENCSREKLTDIKISYNTDAHYLTFKSFTSEGVPLLNNSIFIFPLYTAEVHNLIDTIAADHIDYKDNKFIFYFANLNNRFVKPRYIAGVSNGTITLE